MDITRLVIAGNHDPQGPPIHENNVWIVGDDAEVLVIDPAHDADAVLKLVGGRRIAAVLLTHGHWDHVRAAPRFAELTGVAPRLAPADDFLWRQVNQAAPYLPLTDGQRLTVGGQSVVALHTPGHTPGSTSFWVESLNVVFTGDTLFEGGPGATRWSYSSFDKIIDSITTRLFPLGDEVIVNTGHGPSTTIGAERPQLPEWLSRRW